MFSANLKLSMFSTFYLKAHIVLEKWDLAFVIMLSLACFHTKFSTSHDLQIQLWIDSRKSLHAVFIFSILIKKTFTLNLNYSPISPLFMMKWVVAQIMQISLLFKWQSCQMRWDRGRFVRYQIVAIKWVSTIGTRWWVARGTFASRSGKEIRK